ncbi:MAG: zinc ribbon domain-containing protein [Lentisphaerae bacterium]|nr:zinc ribbon domain-containing protein [Lentisphaerota bacterium]
MSQTIACPQCNNNIAVDLSYPAATCPYCGKVVDLAQYQQNNQQSQEQTPTPPPMQNQFQQQPPQMQNQFQQQPQFQNQWQQPMQNQFQQPPQFPNQYQQQYGAWQQPPQMQFQQQPQMPFPGAGYGMPFIRRRRPGNGLFTTTLIINALAILAAIGLVISVIGMLSVDKYVYYESYSSSSYDYGYGSSYDYGYSKPKRYKSSDYALFEDLNIAFSIASGVLGIAATVLNLISIAKYWSMLPSHITQGKSPAAAACFLLIPLFNIYWLFALHSRLGNGFAQTAGFLGQSAKPMGLVAAILILIGSTQFTVFLAPVGWILALCAYQKAAKVIEP